MCPAVLSWQEEPIKGACQVEKYLHPCLVVFGNPICRSLSAVQQHLTPTTDDLGHLPSPMSQDSFVFPVIFVTLSSVHNPRKYMET